MNTWWLLGIGLLIGAIAVAVLMRRNPAEDVVTSVRRPASKGPIKVKRNTPSRRGHHFYGAAVHIGKNPCDAVRAIADQRFLADEAPRFPLPGCDRAECRCFVQPQNDRRAGFDRRGDSFSAYGNFKPDQHEQKRFSKKDRRHA